MLNPNFEGKGDSTGGHHSVAAQQIEQRKVSYSLKDLAPHYSAVRAVFARLNSDQIGIYRRSELELPNGKDYYMPARLGDFDGLKWISSRPANTQSGIPRSQSSIIIRDAETGFDRFQIPAVEITPAKTALVTMVALHEWLAVHPEPITLGLIGGGSVIRSHLKAAHELLGDSVVRILICSSGDSAKRLVAEQGLNYGCELSIHEEIMAKCNVIISATTSALPLISASDLQSRNQDVFVAGIGFNDIDSDVFEIAKTIISDDPKGYRAHSSYRLTQFLEANRSSQLVGLAELVSGKARLEDRGVTLLMPFGTAMVDLAVSLQILNIDPWNT